MLIKGVALIFMLISFPFISYGAMREISWLWWSGLIALAIGGLIPAASRFFESSG
ncbi:MAG: hypothetical protein AB1553_11225 [Nitrospirota bacterium]